MHFRNKKNIFNEIKIFFKRKKSAFVISINKDLTNFKLFTYNINLQIQKGYCLNRVLLS